MVQGNASSEIQRFHQLFDSWVAPAAHKVDTQFCGHQVTVGSHHVLLV